MKIAVVLFVLSLPAVAAPKPHYTFDPQSLIKTEYYRHDCKWIGDEVHCKKAYLTFGAIKPTTPSVASPGPPSARFVSPQAEQGGFVVRFSPAKCSAEPDRAGRYVCKDVSWRPR